MLRRAFLKCLGALAGALLFVPKEIMAAVPKLPMPGRAMREWHLGSWLFELRQYRDSRGVTKWTLWVVDSFDLHDFIAWHMDLGVDGMPDCAGIILALNELVKDASTAHHVHLYVSHAPYRAFVEAYASYVDDCYKHMPGDRKKMYEFLTRMRTREGDGFATQLYDAWFWKKWLGADFGYIKNDGKLGPI